MRTAIMGVLNLTPDSFSDGGRYCNRAAAIAAAHALIAEGADILDLGGESTRPGAEPVSAEVELCRVLPVLESLAHQVSVRLSIDTMKPAVADACLRAGATLLNDVTGLRDPAMAETVARHHAGVVIMHMRGTPQTMREFTQYADVVGEILNELAPRVDSARRAGIREIYIDPGIGFAKTPAQSLEILRRLREFSALGCPILIGPSRKSFLAQFPGMERPEGRLEGTIAASVIAAVHGASIVRVHDVSPVRKALAVADAILYL
jgi:dihydropteroate synthase